MNKKDLENLENPKNWDWENMEVKSGTKNRRTVISVAFPREDFERVSGCAEQIGVNVSTFIRHAALDAASKVATGTRQHNIPSEPATYSVPTKILWLKVESEQAIRHPEAAITDARPHRVLAITSSQ